MANLRLQREQVLQSLKRDSNSAKRCAAPFLQPCFSEVKLALLSHWCL